MAYQLQGIDLTNAGVTQIDCQRVEGIDLNIYPPHRLHFLSHAIQFQKPLPSEWAMRKAEKKNAMNSGEDKANTVIGRVNPRIRMNIRRRPFMIPEKYGMRKTPFNPNHFQRRGRQSRGRGCPRINKVNQNTAFDQAAEQKWLKEVKVVQDFNEKIRAMIQPTRMRGRGRRVQPPTVKSAVKVFKIKSPEQVVLKSARLDWEQKMKKISEARKLAIKANITTILHVNIPVYFQKKKASQKRRRQEKHLLIKKYKKRLYEIYGQAMFQRGWPISRKQILESLNLKDDAHQPIIEGVAEFMSMVDQKPPCQIQVEHISENQPQYVPTIQEFPTLIGGQR